MDWDQWEKCIRTGDNIWSFDDIELMQFTGMKDKNHKDIYEDDIVLWGGNHDKDLCVIVYDAPSYVLEIKSECGDKDSRVDRYDLRDIEIIGNKWEHPHLLV